MKGLLFTELLEMVEENFGYDTANSIVLQSNLSSKGIYTAARSYHRDEMNILLSTLFRQLHCQTKISIENLSIIFGKHLCKRIVDAYPQYDTYVNRIFAYIGRKATARIFEFTVSEDNNLIIIHNPSLKADCITEGVIQGYLEHFISMNRLDETLLSDGRKRYVLRLN